MEPNTIRVPSVSDPKLFMSVVVANPRSRRTNTDKHLRKNEMQERYMRGSRELEEQRLGDQRIERRLAELKAEEERTQRDGGRASPNTN